MVLACDKQTAVDISAQLKAEEIVVKVRIRSKSSSQSTSKTRYKISKDSTVVRTMRARYFNPGSKISHHVSPLDSAGIIQG